MSTITCVVCNRTRTAVVSNEPSVCEICWRCPECGSVASSDTPFGLEEDGNVICDNCGYSADPNNFERDLKAKLMPGLPDGCTCMRARIGECAPMQIAARAQKWITDHGKHTDLCAVTGGYENECTCGRDAAAGLLKTDAARSESGGDQC